MITKLSYWGICLGGICISYYHVIVLIAVCIGTIRGADIKHFRLFLVLMCILEIVIGRVANQILGSNHIVYNLSSLMSIGYFVYFFYTDLKQIHLKKTVIIGTLLLGVFTLINFIFIQGIHWVNTYSYIAGMSVVLMSIAFYTYEQIYFNDKWKPVKDPAFWLSAGILIFFATAFPWLLFLSEILVQESPFSKPLYNLVVLGNVLLSLAYLRVILCLEPKKHSSKKSSMLPSSSL